MKKSAHILTFHFVTNYGAILQCIALYNTLKKYYKEVKVLNYRPKIIRKDENLISTTSIKSIIDSMYSLPSFFSRTKKFKQARKKYLNETILYKTNNDITEEMLENLFVGSDQIWNFDITDYDYTYFGKFNKIKAKKIFSYAASLGVAELDECKKEKIRKHIKYINKISVREETGAKLINDLIDEKAKVVLDPTLLLEKEEWIRLFNIKKSNKKYIFLYSLTANKETISLTNKVSKILGIPIIEVSGKRQTLKRIPKHKIIYDASPEKFLELLANAQYVVTDSFHATVFSIIFEKKFTTTIHKTRGSRISDLLTKLDIIDRYTNEIDKNQINKNINYKKVKEILKTYQDESKKYIESCVNYNE